MYISIILYMNKKIKHFLRILNHFNAFFWFLRVLLVFLREIGFTENFEIENVRNTANFQGFLMSLLALGLGRTCVLPNVIH